MRNITVVALITLGMSAGCSYHRAISGAARAAKSQDWDLAMQEYAKAQSVKPDSAEAQAGLADAKAKALQTALDDAQTALDEGQYEVVVERIGTLIALNPDAPDAWQLQKDAESALIDHLGEAMSSNDLRTAYELTTRLKKLFPGSKQAEPMFDEIRAGWVAAAEAHLAEKRYDDALRAVAVIAEFEPKQKEALVDPFAQRVREGWADDLVAQARAAERAGHPGQAVLNYAHAFEIAGRDLDRVEGNRVADALRKEGMLQVSLQITGSRSRAATLRAGIEKALADAGDAVLTTGKADLPIALSAPDVTCGEKQAKVKKTRDWVAGQIQIPNPELPDLKQALAEAKAAHDEAHERALAGWAEIERVEAEGKAMDVKIAEAKKELEVYARKHEEARQQHSAALTNRDKATAKLEDARAKNAPSYDIRNLETDLARIAQSVLEWQDAQLRAQADKAEVERKVSTLEQEKKVPMDALAGLRQAYDGVLAERSAHEKARSEATSKLAAAPATVPKDVNKSYAYDEITWTRTCVAPTWASMRPTWGSTIGGEQRHAPKGEVTDVSFPAHAASDLAGDPKSYGERDSTLIATADQQTATALATWLTQLADEHYKKRVEEALNVAAEDPAEGLDELMALQLGAPKRVGEAERAVLRGMINNAGVRDLEVALGIDTKPEDKPEAAVAAGP